MKLLRLKTSDDMELAALLFQSDRSSKDSGLGAILVHGKGGNFAEKHLTDVADTLSHAGIPALTFNNRGADEAGNAREFFDDCLLDAHS